MKGFAMKRIGEVGWIEKPRPECGYNDAIVRPLAVAPCTSDIHTVWEGGIGERHDMILGHEFCGVVEEVGAGVKDFKPGDKVLIAAITPEWNNTYAQMGYSMHEGGMLGGWKFSNIKDGTFAEFVHVNDADGNLAHMPKGMDYGVACMLSDMIPTGFHAAELADVQFGDVVVVFGIGPVGLMAVAATALKGAGRIIVVDNNKHRYEIAQKYGATDFINFEEADVIKTVMEMTNNIGADRCIIAGGNQKVFATAISCLRAGGRIGNVNYLGTGDYIEIPREAWGVGMAHKNIIGGLMPGGRVRLEKLARLITFGKLDPSHMITHKLHGFDKIEEALLLMRDKPEGLIKPVVIISEE